MDSMFKMIIVFMSKGGVGKTTFTSMLAYEMAKYGKVLMIDADQQGNLTSLFIEDYSLLKNDYLTVLKEENSLKDSIVEVRKPHENFYGMYILGTRKNDNNLRSYVEGSFRDSPMVIQDIIEAAKKEGFNYVFMDLPPTLGFYEKIMIANANEVVPIIEPEDFAVDSLTNFTEVLKKIKAQYRAIQLADPKFLILNKENKEKKAHTYWIENIKSCPLKTYEFIDSKAVSSATTMHLTVQEYDAKNKMCSAITDLSEELK